MWSPEEKLPRRAGRALESDLSLRYLAPGAFTVLPPGKQGPPPEPASVANKHRLTPTAKKHRNAAFSIIAEPGSNPGSRSPSPTGRVSPFRGRGFNPAGSRHASPLPSPPPSENRKFPPTRNYHQTEFTKRSKIPTLSRQGSATALFGEKVGVTETTKRTKNQTNMTRQLSQSLNSISPRRVSNKPPPSPFRTGSRQSKVPAFQKLSPIIGSSPEPSPDQHRLKPHSSPSKIPRSRSQPPSTRISPNASNATSRVTSRNPSRNVSRNVSRESSPNKLNSKVNYKQVKAKVNSFNRVKPKVPPKPQVPKTNEKRKPERNESETFANDNNNVTDNAKEYSTNDVDSGKNKTETESANRKKASPENNSKENTAETATRTDFEEEFEDVQVRDVSNEAVTEKNKFKAAIEAKGLISLNKTESAPKLVDLLSPSTTTVVSSTTTTVTQPLKIEAKFDVPLRDDGGGGDTSVYLPDARALSATSVSTAMNRMNDTVLDTRTLMKETNLSSKLPPAASAVIALSNNEGTQQKPREIGQDNTRQTSSSLPPVETVNSSSTNNNNNGSSSGNNNSNNSLVPQLSSNNNNNNNNNSRISSANPVKTVTVEVKPNETNGKSNVISPERGGVVIGLTDALPKSANERIKEARTMVATDVQPIRITVREKPSNTELQSGNVRLPVSATNGINERPSLPPSQPPQEQPPPTAEPPKGICGRLKGCCRKTPKTNAAGHKNEKSKLWGCCSKSKKVKQVQERIHSAAGLIEEEVANQKIKWWQKLRCCRRKKVGDTKEQRKDSWAERSDGYVGAATKKSPKDACKNVLRTIFCLNLCSRKRRKEEEDAINRRASVMSKKKSLTPPIHPEEPKSKLDAGLVEHTSLMKGAIPVLPVPLAWLCLIFNVFLPGTGTIISGFLCLCMGKARFSINDGAKQRVGACIIDLIVGLGQLFTVVFCLVGWGWSIWWGVIMIKIAKKYRKIRRAEQAMENDRPQAAVADENHTARDPERGS